MSQEPKNKNKEIRKKYEKLMYPIGKLLGKTGITPNQWTLIAFIVGLMPIYFSYIHNFTLTLISFLFAVVFDVIDGNVARATGKVTRFGKVLDHTVDRYVEFSFIFALVIGSYVKGWIALFAIFGMLMPSYIRGKGEAECQVEGAGIGFYERKEKIGTILIGSMIYIMGYYQSIILDYTLIVVGLMSHITALQRLIYFRSKCGQDQN